MNREEAREILTHNWTRVDNPNYSESELDEAFFMAIEALTVAVSREDTVTLNSPISIQAEMVAVVRCKDCRHCEECYDTDGYPYWICDEWDSGTDADGYCHYGEKKEEVNGFKSVGQAWNTSQERRWL